MSDTLTEIEQKAVDGDEKGFRTFMVDNVRKMKGDINSQSENWMKETKKAFEDLSKVTGTVGTLEEKIIAFERANLALRNEAHVAGVSVEARLAKHPEASVLFNALARAGHPEMQNDAHKKALDELTTPGSTFLRNDISKIIYDSLPDYGAWPTLGVEPVGTKLTAIPVDTADPIALVVADNITIADDANMTGSTANATVKKIGVRVGVSLELIGDSEYDVAARILKKFARAVAYRMDFLAFMADGTNDGVNGAFTGLFNFATGVNAAATHTTVKLLKLDDFITLINTPDVAVQSRNAKFWAHGQMIARILGVVDGNGRSIFLNALEAPIPAGIGSILGYPVVRANVCPNTDALSQKIIAFGDPDAYFIGLRQDFMFDFSDHAGFAAYQRQFRGVARAAFLGRKASALAVLSTPAA